MPKTRGLIPVARISASHRAVVNAIDAMMLVKDIDIDEESVSIQEHRGGCTVLIDGEREGEVETASASGYLKGWFDAKGVVCEIP